MKNKERKEKEIARRYWSELQARQLSVAEKVGVEFGMTARQVRHIKDKYKTL